MPDRPAKSATVCPLRREVLTVTTDEAGTQTGLPFTIRALDDDVIAVDCPTDYTRSKPSFLVPEPSETYAAAQAHGPGRWSLETGTLRVEAQADPPRIRIYRTSDAGEDPVCQLREPTPEAASIFIDRGFALYGVGGNNALKLRTTHDIDLLTDIDLDRRDKVYRIHHRETGQGVNHMPWVLSAQGFGLFLDSSFPMTLDLRDGFGVEGQNIRTYYFINGPTPAEAVSRFVKLTGLPPMHPAWALGYEQSSRTWMNPGELDFVTTYFREKRIPCDGFVLLSTYGGDGGVGRSARGFHAGYPDLYQGWNPYGSYTGYNPKLLPGGAEDIQRLRERGFHPIVHGYWASDYSDPEAAVEVINLRLVILGISPKPAFKPIRATTGLPDPLTSQEVYFDGTKHKVPVFRRADLGGGCEFVGPAILLQDDTTTCVLDDFKGCVDPYGNLILERVSE